ncbi:hypothetical protein AB0L59_36125 [Streptomyces sp. NPDC052109]|uniref:hypothetical protein n=1 Tax=Streptomyces sp. NPDC052109 TaxID=3155527 RepID=UPI003415EAE0
MNLRLWVAAPLAGAAIALVFPSPGVAAQASARHVSGFPLRLDGDGDQGHRNPWRNCYSQRRVVLIDKTLRVILTNGRRGPEALFLQGDSGPSSPAAPWDSFSVESYMDVNHPTHDTAQYEFEVRDFFRVHPLFVVKAFDRHERVFPFPAAHCRNDQDDGGRAGPHGGTSADGSGSSGSPSPGTLAPGSALSPVPRDTAAAGWSAGLLSAKHIVIAVGGLVMILGMLAVAWLRRRRSAE